MEPGVPFALLGAVVLLAVASWAALAGAAAALRGGRGPAAVVAAGALVLIVVETLTGTSFGTAESDDLLLARAAGLLLVAAGLYSGALARRSGRRPPADGPPLPQRSTSITSPALAAGVVAPLGGATGPALLGAAAALLAAAAALRARHDLGGALVSLGLLVAGAAAGAAPLAADGDDGPLLVLALRGGGAALVLVGLVVLARSSLLAKVVSAILAGVLLMAVVAVGVVGTTVAQGYEREQAALVRDAADGREQLLQQTLDRTRVLTPVFAEGCARTDPALDPAQCDAFVRLLTEERSENFALLVPRSGEPRSLGGRAALSPAESLGLAGSDLVAQALAGGPNAPRDNEVAGPVRLIGPEPSLALVVVQPLDRPTPTAEAGAAFVYGVRIGQTLVDDDFEAGGFGFSLLVDDAVVASNLSDRARQDVAAIATAAGSLPPSGVTVASEGTRPTVHLRPLSARDGSPVGVLALSRTAEEALSAQRDALRALLLTALATTAVVAALALLLGRRTVEPVRRLTTAAERVAAGDLRTTTGVRGRDEVGTLARAFDSMTGSLSSLTGDLRASATRLETVLSSMTDGLLATDADGRVTSVNRAALAMLGDVGSDTVLGRPLSDVVDLRSPAGDALAGSLLTAVMRDEPAEVHSSDGTVTPVRAARAPLDAGDGAPGGVVLVLRDTSREREVERMKTEFLSNVSHELRTPLTPIRGYADILASRPGLDPKQVTGFAGTILAESLKMNRVVDLLVDVAAIEAGRVEVVPRAVAARDLLDERLAAWRERAPERSADLRRRVSTGLPPVLVDPVWLGKVLDELVDNAVKHTPPGTGITLAATPSVDSGRVRLSVRDTGPGIDLADRELMFTSFEQKDGSATRRVGGLGLGLSFVRRVAQDAGWPLEVASEPGRGAEFSLQLPVADVPPPPPRPRRARSPRRAAPSARS